MNTHVKIGLPPLPTPDADHYVNGTFAPVWKKGKMEAYARATIEADRQQWDTRTSRSVEQLKEALLNRNQRFVATHSEVKNLIEYYEADRQTTDKQFAAYKRLTESLEGRIVLLQKQYDKLKKTTDPSLLASERATNTILTEELEADRKRTADLISVYQGKIRALEAENYALVSDLDEQQCPQFWAWIRHAYREPESAAYTVYNMEVAYQAGRASVEADHQRRGEPVKVEPICGFIKADHGDYPVLQWKPGYKAVIGDKFYLAPQPAVPDVLPGEAIFGFAAWLTSLKTPVTFSECHGAAIVADLAAAYNTSQGFDQVREDFHKRLKPYPKYEPSQPAEPVKEVSAAPAALRFAAQVVELYDDATMDNDYMIDSGDCAGILSALADYFSRFNTTPPADGQAQQDAVCVAPTSDKPTCGAQNVIHATQPHQIPEPILLHKSMSPNYRNYAKGWNACRAAMLEATPEPKDML